MSGLGPNETYKLPYYPAVRESMGHDTHKTNMVMRMREALELYKKCGINAAKAYVYADDLAEEYGPHLAAKNESNIGEINWEVQRIMAEHDLAQMSSGQKVRAANELRHATVAEEIPAGELGDVQIVNQDEVQPGALRAELERIAAQPPAGLSSQMQAVFRDMWTKIDKEIEPGAQVDLDSKLGQEYFAVRTVIQDRCPISGLPFENVVRTRCGHHFSRASIREYIEREGEEQVVCPVSACRAYIRFSELVRDPEFERRVKRSGEKAARLAATQRRNIDTLAD